MTSPTGLEYPNAEYTAPRRLAHRVRDAKMETAQRDELAPSDIRLATTNPCRWSLRVGCLRGRPEFAERRL